MKDFEEIMNQFVFEGYHYTRVYNIKDITENGIFALSEKTLNIIKNNIKEKYSSDSDYIEVEFKKFQKEKLKEKNTKFISASTNENQALNETEDILKHYGGEAIEDYFGNNNTKIYHKLSQIGIPVIIKFNFKYNELSDSTKRNLENSLYNVEQRNEKQLIEKNKILEKLELRIENCISIDRIQGYYILDEEDLSIKDFISI